MQRYAVIARKIPREIVLLRGLPCIWGRCSFCDYIDDNTVDEDIIQQVADRELARVTGEFGRLEVINSGSIQELTLPVRRQIRDLLIRLNIKEFICESYWGYRNKFDETREFFRIPTRIKVGVETFDDHLRNDILNKGMKFDSPADVARLTDTICLMVGLKGQSRDSVRRDMEILQKYFRYGCISLFTENSKGPEWVDEDLKGWFAEEFSFLEDEPNIEILWSNTDFGVGSPDS